MAISVEWVGYGWEAAEALWVSIAHAKGDEALAPVTVVVPSNHVGVATRRLLASGTLGPTCRHGVGLVAVSFLTPYRLAELLGAPSLAATGRRPVSTPVIAAALRASLADDPGLFGPFAEHPATETALVATYRELREVDSAGLDAIAATGARAADVVRLHRATRERLEPQWYDEQDLMRSAAATLGGDDRSRAADLGVVVVYLPQRVSPHAQLLFETIGGVGEITVVAATTGDLRSDADVVAAVRRLSPTASEPAGRDPHLVAAVDRTRIVLTSDADDEVRTAVRRVIDEVRSGTPLDRIAMLHSGGEPYGRLAHEHLAAAGITSNGPSVTPLAGRVAGRALLELIALPARGFRRQDVFAWLTTAPMLRRGDRLPVGEWETLSRNAGNVAGRADWDTRLSHVADRLDARALAADPEQESVARFQRRLAASARDLRTFVLALIDDLVRAAARPRRWREHSRWAHKQLAAFVGGADQLAAWPLAERKAAERVNAAIDRLDALDLVEGPVSLEVFARTLELELDTDLGRVGRLGEGVLVGPIAMGIGLDLDLVVVLGLAEGSFPAPVHDDSLLPDHDREAASGQLPLKRQRVDREHRELLAALASSDRHFLGVPRGDLRRSSERVPSRWVLDIASALAGTRWWTKELVAAQVEWVEHVASFDAGLRRLNFPATAQEHHLRSLLVAQPRDATALAATADDDVLARNALLIASRRASAFTRFDGNLSGLTVPSPIDTTVSATRLESWAACPYAYFVQYVLDVRAVENPEDTLRISPIDHGVLVHLALERFIAAVVSRPMNDRPQPDDPWSPDDRALLHSIGEDLCDRFEAEGLTGRPIFWRRDRQRVLTDLDGFLDADRALRHEQRTRPIAVELSFGFPGDAVGPVPLALSDGRLLRFRGKADRVDHGDDGSLHVLDYKTGKAKYYRNLSQEDPDQRGHRLQLAVYGAAARQHAQAPDAAVRADYWFVSARERFARAGYPVTDDVLSKVGTTLGTIVTGIEGGVFASHPTEASSSFFPECDACDPDHLGVTELRRAWERKRFDPALTAYAQLSEPLDFDTTAADD
jgi:ATP-dependent helicase/nuclease subunit B